MQSVKKHTQIELLLKRQTLKNELLSIKWLLLSRNPT